MIRTSAKQLCSLWSTGLKEHSDSFWIVPRMSCCPRHYRTSPCSRGPPTVCFRVDRSSQPVFSYSLDSRSLLRTCDRSLTGSISVVHPVCWNASLRRTNRPKPFGLLPDLPGGHQGSWNMRCSRGHGRPCHQIHSVSLTRIRPLSGWTVSAASRRPGSSPISDIVWLSPSIRVKSSLIKEGAIPIFVGSLQL